jgi:chromosome partitioning protein
MARIIVIANQKGGVAKTTTAHCMATGLIHKQHKVLAIDADPQGSLSYIMGADLNKPGLYELLRGEVLAPDAVQNIEQGSIVSSNSMLSRVNFELTGMSANNRLSEALEPFKPVYDFIVIDTPPTLGVLSISGLVAADDIIIPVTADALSLQGLSQLYSTIKMVKQKSNPSLKIAGILLCRCGGRTVLARDLKQTTADRAEQMGTKLFHTTIREGVALKESQAKKTNPFKALLKSRPANDYLDFITEYLETEKGYG